MDGYALDIEPVDSSTFTFNILHSIFYILAILLMPLGLTAQDCEAVKISDFSKKDLPSAFDREHLKEKESYKYYYGVGVPVDYVKARHIAFIEFLKDSVGEGPFTGPSILLMLYANGYGVKRDLGICIRLACANVGGAPAEIDERIKHLQAIKSGEDTAVFDICDDITSGYMMGFCQSIWSELADVKRKASIDSVIKKWPLKDQVAYMKLRKSASDFFEVRAGWEVDMSGTARVMLEQQESDSLEDNFLHQIIQADHCTGKQYSSENFIEADKELNAVYSTIMNSKKFEWGTITKEGIRLTQRKWVQYRDAWVIFGAIRCPGITADSWKTLLTKERMMQLKEFVDE